MWSRSNDVKMTPDAWKCRRAALRCVGLTVGLCCAAVFGQEVFVDEGACPGEGCQYGEIWTAREAVVLRERASPEAAVVATVEPGERVRTITGEVHTEAGRFEVQREHGDFRPGDEVLVFTYLGEGWFRLQHEGEIKEADLGFSPWGGSAGRRCNSSERCWGSLHEELRFDWWVLVRADSGSEGWIRLEQGVLRDRWSFR